jgi:hypothetical protein
MKGYIIVYNSYAYLFKVIKLIVKYILLN